MKGITFLGAGAALLLSLAVSAAEPPMVSILLASPMDARLSVSADSKGLVFPLEYRKRHGPFSLAPGKHQWAVKVGSTILETSSHTLDAGSNYLMALAGPVAAMNIVWVKLDLEPSKDAVKLRLVNLAPEVPAVSLRRGSDTLYQDLPYKKTGASVTVAPGGLPVELTRSDTGERLAGYDSLALASGKSYTLLAFGTASKPELMVVEN